MKILTTIVLGVVAIIALALAVLAGLIVPWTINVFGSTLWPTHMIPYTWETALAGLLVLTVLCPRITVNKKA
jgi:hypothetical protein